MGELHLWIGVDALGGGSEEWGQGIVVLAGTSEPAFTSVHLGAVPATLVACQVTQQ